MGRRPKGTSLDRIKGGSSNYTKSNCRWATPSQQCRNLSRNVNITIGDQTKCITDWCAHFNIGRSTVYARIKRGFSPLDALVLPVRRYRYRGILVEIDGVVKGTMEWARHYGLKEKTVNKRLSRGWDRVRAVSTPVKISK